MMSSSSIIRYGQVVCGPPGSGKTTYCEGMQQYLQLIGRKAYVINLDPANEAIQHHSKDTEENNLSNDNNINTSLPYDALYDVCIEAVNVTSVMEQLQLGPNGGLIYCMEYMEEHLDTIISSIEERIREEIIIIGSIENTTPNTNSKEKNSRQPTKTPSKSDVNKHKSVQQPYLLFDLPGQVELYTHSTCVQHIMQSLIKKLNLRLTAVQLIDSNYCTEPNKFISAALLGTTTMIRLELPIVNVLSKIDLLALYGSIPFQLDYFMNCHDLDRLIPLLSSSSSDHPEAKFMTDDDDDDEDDYTNDPEYQRLRKKRMESSFYKKYIQLHKSIGK